MVFCFLKKDRKSSDVHTRESLILRVTGISRHFHKNVWNIFKQKWGW